MKSYSSLKTLAHIDTLTFSALQMILFSLVPFIAEESFLSVSEVVTSFSVGSFLFLFSSPFWATRSDRWGRVPVLVVGIAGLAFSTALLLLSVLNLEGFTPLIALWSSRILYGLTASAVVPVCQALQLDIAKSGDSAMKSLFSNSMSLNIGRVLGPLYLIICGWVGGFLWALFGLFTAMIVLLFFNFVHINSLEKPKQQTSQNSRSWFQELGLLFEMKSVFILAILFTSFIGVLNFSLAALLQQAFQLSTKESGTLMAQMLLLSACMAVATQYVGKLIFKNPWQGALIIGSLALLVGSYLLGNLNSYVALVITLLFLSVGLSLLPPSYTTLMATRQTQSIGLGQRAGVLGAANTIGYSLGGLLAAFTFNSATLEIPTVLMVLSGLILLNIGILYRSRHLEVRHA